jgi:hypothetical protein
MFLGNVLLRHMINRSHIRLRRRCHLPRHRLLLPAVLLGMTLLCACSRTDVAVPAAGKGAVSASAAAAAAPASAPAASAVVTSAPPAAVQRDVPPEDRLEPVSIDQAKLPGGVAMPTDPADPAPPKKKTTP